MAQGQFVREALREHNMSLPACSKWHTSLEGLPASARSRIGQRALELEFDRMVSMEAKEEEA